METGYVISDLHLFTHRTAADGYAAAMSAAAGEADFFVLNGDIFDFRWTTLPSIEATADAAIEWLDALARKHPTCRFFYVLGNHDGLEFFADRLDALAERTPNFEWRPSHLRVGKALFLHGDLPLRSRHAGAFERTLRQGGRKRSKMSYLGYHVFMAAHMHRCAARVQGSKRFARRILRRLRQHGNGLAEGLSDVYFGHTHRAFSDFSLEGITFHNTGSAIRGLKCNPLAVRPWGRARKESPAPAPEQSPEAPGASQRAERNCANEGSAISTCIR